jgi:type IV pilus assembly protein PilY1
MAYPIPSDATFLDRDTSDGNGYVDRIYIPDLGGNVWRVDLQPAAGAAAIPQFGPSTWKVTKLASVGGTPSETTRRKIFFAPDVVTTSAFDAVVFATGDREHPTLAAGATNVINRFYMIKDVIGNDASATTVVDDTSNTADNVPTGLFNSSPVLPTSASSTPFLPGATFDASNPSYSGFYVTLRNVVATRQPDGSTVYGPSLEQGEKSVNAPATIGGNVFFGTNTPITPVALTCQPNLGTARGYAINFITGALNFNVFDGGGLPPSPVTGLVDVGGLTVPFIIGGAQPAGSSGPPSTSAIGASEATIPIAPVRSRTYWYRDLGNR